MTCSRISADVLDSTNQNMIGHESLEQEDTWWELTQEQRSHFEALKDVNSYLREEYHAIHELLWKSNQVTLYSEMPKRYINYIIIPVIDTYYIDISIHLAGPINLVIHQIHVAFMVV